MSNEHKGLSSILLILAFVGLTIVIGGYLLTKETWTASVEYSDSSNESESGSDVHIKEGGAYQEASFNINVDDMLGEMKVISVEPFRAAYSELALNNMRVVLVGPIEITGTYEFVRSEIGFSGYCMTDFDMNSLIRLPQLLPNEDNAWFCFRNDDVAREQLGEEKKRVTVRINNYELVRYPSEVVDRADLVEVVGQ